MVTTVCNVLGSGGGGGVSPSSILEVGNSTFVGSGNAVTITITDVGSMDYKFIPVATGDSDDVGNIGEVIVEPISSTSVKVYNTGLGSITFDWTVVKGV